MWSDRLGLWLGTWEGTLTKETATWLRFYDAEGNLILLSQELAEIERERAEQECLRAEQAELALAQLRDRLQQMGIDPNQLPK